MSASSRSTSGSASTAKCWCRSTKMRRAQALGRVRESGIDALAIVLMHGWRHTAHEARLARNRARARLHAGFRQPRSRAPDQAHRPRRHDGGRCLSVAGAAALRRPGRGWPAGRDRSAFHAVERRPCRGERVSRQGRDPVRARRRRCRHGRGQRAARRRAGSSASTWAGPRPTSRIMPGAFELADESVVAGSPHPRADDADPHRCGRRRIDLPLRRNAFPRRAGKRRRESRARPATATAAR